MTDEKGGVVFFNNACKDLLGDIKGNITDVFKPFYITPPIEVFFNGNEKMKAMEFSHKERQGVFLAGKINRIVSQEGGIAGYIIIFRDISEEKREEMIERSFLSLISHKLKTPLVSIVGYSDLYLQKDNKDIDIRESFKSVNRQGRYLTTLVDKLLNFSVIESGNLKIDRKSVRLSDVIKETLDELADYLNENQARIEVDPVFTESQSTVFGDSSKLVTVLKNLVENSVKFNSNQVKSVTIKYYGSDNMAGICVEDDGPGIALEQRKNIFKKFYQFEESFTGQVKGVGLGLALCKLIIEAHNGRIGFESSVGNGSKFYFEVPKI